jgi:hypothetical protein
MLKKFLATVSVVGLIAGGASALEIVPQVVAADTPVPAGQPIVLAAELDYDGDAVFTTGGVAPLAAGQGRLTFSFHPTGVAAGASFPTGNVLLRVTVDGARFRSALTGAEVTSGGTSVISEGGARNASDVTFLLSDVSTCVVGNCTVNLPLILEGGNVAVNVGLETDAGAPIDNTSLANLKRAVLAVEAPAFDVTIIAAQDLDGVPTPLTSLPGTCGPTFGGLGNVTNATLASEYLALSDDFGPPGARLGLISVQPRVVPFASAVSPCASVDIVRSSIGGTPVVAADVSDVIVSIEGTMDAFEDGDFLVNGVSGSPDADDDTAAVDGLVLALAMPVVADPDGVTVITRSSYDVTVEVAIAASSDLTRGVTVSGEIDPIGRQGTQVTFPWTQSATQAEASGASSVFRIGNLTTSDTGTVYAEVLNSSAAGFTSGGLIELTDAIEANGEFVINSAQLEAAVGDYGRGDVNFIVEAESDELTARQFVVRNGNIQQVIGGTVQQDQN